MARSNCRNVCDGGYSLRGTWLGHLGLATTGIYRHEFGDIGLFTLRIPFGLPDNYRISDIDGVTHEGHVSCSLIDVRGHYTLVFDGLESENLAEEYLQKAWLGFNGVLLDRGVPIDWQIEAQRIVRHGTPQEMAAMQRRQGLANTPDEVHGFIGAESPSILKVGEHYGICAAGEVKALHLLSAKDLIESFDQSVTYCIPKDDEELSRLNLALDLYAAYFTETTRNAKFLALIMALESLSTPISKNKADLDAIDKAEALIRGHIDGLPLGEEERAGLTKIIDTLRSQTNLSKTQQVKALVLRTLDYVDHPETEELADLAVKLYRKRGKLVHTGHIDKPELTELTMRSKDLVQAVLKSEFKRLTSD